MNELKRINVNIAGKSITLVSDEPEDYIRELARYIDKKNQSLASVSNNSTKLLLLAINIADELFKERKRNDKHKYSK